LQCITVSSHQGFQKQNMSLEKLVYVNPAELIIQSNIRDHMDEESIRGLMASIQAIGIKQPLRACLIDGRMHLLEGARRHFAATKLGLEKVPIIVEAKPLSEAETIQTQLIANCQREDLTPVAHATALRELMRLTQWNATETAKQLGMSVSTLTKLVAILNLPQPILDKVQKQSIPMSCAYALTQEKDPQKQQELAEQLASGELTRDALTKSIESKPHRPRKPREGALIRVSINLSPNRTVVITEPGLDMGALVATLTEALSRAKRERKRGTALDTFAKLMRDQAALPIKTSGE
jgi:ParB family transcriptional regulator, chromosome partitioning protein